MTTALIMLLALGLEAIFGWPAALHRRIGHPVTWIGALISRLEQRLNHATSPEKMRLMAGVVTVVIVVLVSTGVAFAVTYSFSPIKWPGILISAVFAASLLAGRSLHDHVLAVATPLSADNIGDARHAVAQIVGRDPAALDEAGIARAALESLGENASDGVIAPLFWGLIFGLPGIAAYKAINTLDSMIGYRTARYASFGKFAARLDDVVNWVPARLCAGLLALASLQPRVVVPFIFRDAQKHRSPNAGWPETAMAAALGCRLSGPRSYDGVIGQQPWLNGEASDPTPGDLLQGLQLYRRMLAGVAVILFSLALI